MKKSLLAILIFFTISCRHSIDSDYVRQHEWKYGEGDGWIGDWLCFKETVYKLSNDTLFKHDTARAIIVYLDRINYGDNEIIIKLIKDGSIGYYHEK